MNGFNSQEFERRRPKPRNKKLRRCPDCTRPLSVSRRPSNRHPNCKECRRAVRESEWLQAAFQSAPTLRGF